MKTKRCTDSSCRKVFRVESHECPHCGKKYPRVNSANDRYAVIPVCKTVSMSNGYDQTYKLSDGQWVYDGSLQKWFEDPWYDYEPLRYEIPAEKENPV